MMCSVEGCPKVAKSRGWCSAHYERWRRNGEPGPAGDARIRPVEACSVEGCDRQTRARGLCDKHYLRWKRNGSADDSAMQRPGYGTGRALHASGYVMVREPDHPLAMAFGYVFEHRKVLHDAGIEVGAQDHVHHINEDKTDNRLENLEVIAPGAHQRLHLRERGYVRNQFGVWSVGRDAKTRNHENYLRKKARSVA